MNELNQDLINKLHKYKTINTHHYRNLNQYKFIENILSFYKKRKFLTQKQQEKLNITLNSFFLFVEKYPIKYKNFIDIPFLIANNILEKIQHNYKMSKIYQIKYKEK